MVGAAYSGCGAWHGHLAFLVTRGAATAAHVDIHLRHQEEQAPYEPGARATLRDEPAPGAARIFVPDGELPLSVLNGAPASSICWTLSTPGSWSARPMLPRGLPAVTSFKHTAPGLAWLELSPSWRRRAAWTIWSSSPLAAAYARARGAELASFGDFAAFSRTVDLAAARVLSREVSDGVIAPGYDADALTVLRRKKGGKYLVLEIDPAWTPSWSTARSSASPSSSRNDATVTLGETVTARKEIPESARRDMLLAAVTSSTPVQQHRAGRGRAGHRDWGGTAVAHPLHSPRL